VTKLIAISQTELPMDPDLRMVFAAKVQWYRGFGERTYLLVTDLTADTDAGAVALRGWLTEKGIDLVYG
jgi:hypothetical protein